MDNLSLYADSNDLANGILKILNLSEEDYSSYSKNSVKQIEKYSKKGKSTEKKEKKEKVTEMPGKKQGTTIQQKICI